MNLTNKQTAFISAYLRSWNATRAAIQAGYSEHSARAIGSENLTKPAIFAEIQRRIDETAMSANEVLARLAEQARSDMGDFIGLSVDEIKQAGQTHLVRRINQTKTTSTAQNGAVTQSESVAIELYDAQAALVHIGKYHKLFVSTTVLPGADGAPLLLILDR